MNFRGKRINFPSWSRLLKEGIVLVWVQLLVIAPNHAGFFGKKAKIAENEPIPVIQVSEKTILQDSYLSYNAFGGFTNVKSFGVILSCKNGKISVLKTIHNPKRNRRHPTLRQREKMDKDTYLSLWRDLQRQRIFHIKDAPDPKMDILDEFTYHFEVKVGEVENKFRIYGMSRPGGSRYFALRQLIDGASNMVSLWEQHGGSGILVSR
ncbi:hypothetical protein BVX98_00270 [bacterium F11]|nr:hypothetical protein BVX98_00270 [bacterium F11]